jgi:tRNA 5-methylaminomethyl-2-thiouridine biosynthesis bifunctional protein
MNAHVPLPDFAMREGTPVSNAFDDVYFSRAGGIAETEHVFLRGNGLPSRWYTMGSGNGDGVGFHPEPPRSDWGLGAVPPSNNFTILETGFGTGLNFLVTWAAFVRAAPSNHRLHYISLEKFPLTPDMLREALSAYPELAEYASQLIGAYPLRLPGFHRIHFPRVTLTLGFGDAAEMLSQLFNEGDSPLRNASPSGSGWNPTRPERTLVDAWFLDGFSPAKNAEMWSDTLFSEIGRLSNPGTTFATFTSAGFVRRGLATQGFVVEKVPGYGHKREMCVGIINKPNSTVSSSVRSANGTREPESEGRTMGLGGFAPNAAKPRLKALVLGGGIAGCTLAYALAESGISVTLLERGNIASGASGNPAGVLFPQLTKRWTASAAWYFAAYSFTLHQLARWKASGLVFSAHEVGMLRLPRHAKEEAQLRTLNETLELDREIVHWVDATHASVQAGVQLATGGAFFKRGTWVAPVELCRALLAHPNITHHTECEVVSLTKNGMDWEAKTRDGDVFAAEKCCIAAARESAAFFPSLNLRISDVGGQLSEIAAGDVAATLSTILCHKGYVIPCGDRYLIGATYNHGDSSYEITTENHQKNIADVETFLPGWIQGMPRSGRTSMRATTPDRLPYIGEIAENVWVSAGHGSRGLISAPLAAEMIASEICGEGSPITTQLRSAINPLRFRS